MIKVLFLVPYPLQKAPSQRFRVELYLPVLDKQSIVYRVEPFLDDATWSVLYKESSGLRKVLGVLKGFLKRIAHVLFLVPFHDYVFIHREASPIGPPIFEFIISRVFRKRIIYDFDDAIWIPNTSSENRLINWIKAFWKVKYICGWAYKVSAGNEYLCAYARQFNKDVVFVPTCVDVEKQHNQLKNQEGQKIVIGWTGSHSTMKYLNSIVPTLKKISQDYDNVEVLVISNKPTEFSYPKFHFNAWQEATEISDLLHINIGLMPLAEDAWSEGKCGFKLIQYLALGIPAVASPVGVNRNIVDTGVNGFLCSVQDDWYSSLRRLVEDSELRSAMGMKGRAKIVEYYSIQANTGVFLRLFT